ncbi:MAG: hypothetical protein JNM17_16910 [Archangium sp.]|nr:hypothetical protein [Archangium sp.]
MKKFVLAVAVLACTSARADGIDGMGHVSIGGGFRWLPNWWFKDKAAAAGTPMNPGVDGGPQAIASFGLGVTSVLAISVNLIFGYHGFSLARPDGLNDEYSSVTAGALIGGRLQTTDVLFKGFMPYLELQAGPVLSVLGGPREMIPEKAILGLSAAGGATYRFHRSYGLTLEVRYLQARNAVPEISGINVGGVWFSAMFTIFFPPAPKSDLAVPSF